MIRALPFAILLLAAPGSHAGKIYFTDRGASQVMTANFDGTSLQTIIPSAGTNIRGIAIDVASDDLFYADNGGDDIYRARLDGSGRTPVVSTGLGFPADIALDRQAGKLYWCDRNNHRIERANYDGSSRETLITTTQPYYLDLDLTNGKIYWGDFAGGNLFRANLADGSGQETLVTGLVRTRGVKVDPGGGYFYWCDRDSHKVQRRKISGGSIEDLYSGLDTPHGMTLDIPAKKIYWVDTGTNGVGGTGGMAISRGDMDGSGTLEVLAEVNQPWDITLDQRTNNYADWIARRFRNDAPDSSIEMGADPDGDGHRNLLEYFCDLDPHASQPIHPVWVSTTGGEYFFTYRKASPTRTDVIPNIELAGDLQKWESAGMSVIEHSTTPHNTTFLLRPEAVLPSGSYLRLRLRLAAP